GLEHALLPACEYLGDLRPFEQPVDEVDVIGERVHDRRRCRVAPEHRQGLRARVEYARGRAYDPADAPLPHRLFGDEVALLVAATVAHAQIGLAPRRLGDDAVGLGELERDRLFHQHRLPALERLQHGRGVRALARGNDYGVDVRARNHLEVVPGMTR